MVQSMGPVEERLPAIFKCSQDILLITQGAEGLLYQTNFLSLSMTCALKVRPSKAYRHPVLDQQLTRQRIVTEAKILLRCVKEGVRVPGIMGADWDAGWLALEWINGRPVRISFNEALKKLEELNSPIEEHAALNALMQRIGSAIGALHAIGIIHGDLTTSNMMLKQHQEELSGDIYLIDFGLATMSLQNEDRAVDLYVLERAFSSTHPQAQNMFQKILQAYENSFIGGIAVLKRLEDVRLRGRKKSMLG